MRSRMERYVNNEEEVARTTKNQKLYHGIYNDEPSSNVTVLNNESEIDISKIKELIESRDGYKRVKDYKSVFNDCILENDREEYDIYEDIDNKIYDINTILEDAKNKRKPSEREKYRNLRNTQYDILSKLNLNEESEPEEMVTDFFTQDKTMKDLITSLHDEFKENKSTDQTRTSVDLFDDLRGNDNTILTEAVTEDKIKNIKVSNDDEKTFYTNSVNFTKEDFEGFQNLQTTVKKNNNLIRVLIIILTIVLLAAGGFVIFTII